MERVEVSTGPSGNRIYRKERPEVFSLKNWLPKAGSRGPWKTTAVKDEDDPVTLLKWNFKKHSSTQCFLSLGSTENCRSTHLPSQSLQESGSAAGIKSAHVLLQTHPWASCCLILEQPRIGRVILTMSTKHRVTQSLKGPFQEVLSIWLFLQMDH